jgi:hypothetical protein
LLCLGSLAGLALRDGLETAQRWNAGPFSFVPGPPVVCDQVIGSSPFNRNFASVYVDATTSQRSQFAWAFVQWRTLHVARPAQGQTYLNAAAWLGLIDDLRLPIIRHRRLNRDTRRVKQALRSQLLGEQDGK